MHRRLLSLARGSRLALTATIVTGLLGGWLIIWQAGLVSSTISGVFLAHDTLAQVAKAMGLLLLVIAGRGILIWANELAANRIAQGVKIELRDRLLQHILALGPAYSQGERTGELTATSVEGIEALDAYFGEYLPQLVLGILVPASILLVVFPRDWLSGVILLLTAPLIPFFMYMIGHGAEATARRQYGSLGRLSSYFLDSLQGLTTLKAFGQSKAQARNIGRVSDEFRRATLKVMQGSFLSAFALELLATISTAIIAVEVGLRLLYSQMQFNEALFLLILAPEFYMPLRVLGMRFHAGLAGTAAARRIFEILDMPLPLALPPGEDPRGRQSGIGSDQWAIQLSGVAYRYPGADRLAVQDISVQITPGQHIALVGATGSGKSTLVSLLLGFVQPTRGRISFRSDSGQVAYGASRRDLIAWVPQRPHLFHDTIIANMRMGSPNARLEDVVRAAGLARLDNTIQALPKKYATSVAEAGSRLSKGEAQRLAVARAFLRNAPILLLDEPTSSLDPENEALLEESARQLMRGRTVVTVAHRLNTVSQADQIIVLREGRIVEVGRHQELLALGGEYCRLVDASAEAWLKPDAEAASRIISGGGDAVLGSSYRRLGPSAGTGSPQEPALFAGAPSQSSLGAFRRLLSFLGGSWAWIAVAVLLGSLTVGSSVALLGTSAWLISTAALHPSIAALDLAIVGVRFFGIARAVFRYLERLVTHSVTLQLLRNLRVWFYEKLEPLAPGRLMHYASGDLLARVVDDVNTLENFFVRIVAPPFVAALVGLGVCGYLAFEQASLTLPFLGFFLIVGFLIPTGIRLLSGPAAANLVRSRAKLETLLVDSIQGLADVVAFGLEADRLQTMRSAEATYAAAQTRLARLNGLHSALTASLPNLAMWSVLMLAIPLVSSSRLDGVMLAPIALITLSAFEAVSPLPLAALWWNPVRAAAGRMFELVDTRPPIGERLPADTPAQRLTPESGAFAGALDLQVANLTFTYPGERTPALQDLSFHVAAGHSLGIVGPSGAGKSTLVHLLMRFWEYDSGEVYLGGIPVIACSADDVRRQIGLVSQDAHFFDTSIYENLRLARRGVCREDVEEAARQAQIHDFIAGLPIGYDTLVGEHGLRLSAGERQRLAIARALIKDAPVLILDEPTANLDAATERLVLETLFQLMKRKTSLLITHRLVGLENLDEILVLSRGGVVERGPHASLLAGRGTYRRLWQLQNRAPTRP